MRQFHSVMAKAISVIQEKNHYLKIFRSLLCVQLLFLMQYQCSSPWKVIYYILCISS